MCEEILVDSVICSDTLCVHDCDKNILIPNVTIPEGSTICGTVSVAVLELRPIIDRKCGIVIAAVTLFIENELTVITPDCRTYPLEYGFRIERLINLDNCCFPQIEQLANVSGLNLLVFGLCTKNEIILHPSTELCPASFDEKLTVNISVKLVIKKQLTIPDNQLSDCNQSCNCGPNFFPLAAILPFVNKGDPQNYRY